MTDYERGVKDAVERMRDWAKAIKGNGDRHRLVDAVLDVARLVEVGLIRK
jgi:hypothetical protein